MTSSEMVSERPPGATAASDTGVPPDTTGAVGRTHVMSASNFYVRVQDRGGTVVSERTLMSFWDSLLDASGRLFRPARTSPYDPVITYDPLGRRWIFVCNSDGSAASSRTLVAVSRGENPTFGANVYATWHGYIIYTSDARFGLPTCWADQPVVGFNHDIIAIANTLYTIPDSMGNSSFLGCCILALDRTSAYNGTLTVSGRRVASAGRMAPAQTLDASDILHCVDFQATADASYYYHSTLRRMPDGQSEFRDGLPRIHRSEFGEPAYMGPASLNGIGPQQNTTALIDTGDSRLHSAIVRDGRLVTANRIAVNDGGGSSRVQWVDINTETWSVNRIGRFGANGTHLAYPTAALNRNGDILIGCSVLSSATFPSAGFAYRAAGDANFRPVGIYRNGGTSLNVAPPIPAMPVTGVNYVNRFGDYSATCVDPLDDQSFWTLQTSSSAFLPADRYQLSWAAIFSAVGVAPPTITSAREVHTYVNAETSVQMTALNLPAIVTYRLEPEAPGTVPSWIRVNTAGRIDISRPPTSGRFLLRQVIDSVGDLDDTQPLTIVVAPSALADAIDYPFRSAVSSRGDSEWFRETHETSDGRDAAQSGPIRNGLSSTLQVVLTGPTRGAFDWKTSSQQGSDILRFYIDDVEIQARSGVTVWETVSFEIPPGEHRLVWTFQKDGSGFGGLDCAWVDQLHTEDSYFPYYLDPPPEVRFSIWQDGLFEPPIPTDILRFEWVGQLPPGLLFDPQTGKLQGRASSAGKFTGKLRAINLAGAAETDLTLQVSDQLLNAALGQPNIEIITSSPKGWTPDSSIAATPGGSSAGSAIVNRGESTWMEAKFPGPATIGFWWKVDGGSVALSLDGTEKSAIKGREDWNQRWVAIPSGQHTLRWTYTYDHWLAGEQAGRLKSRQSSWVDELQILPSEAPKIVAPAQAKVNRYSYLSFVPAASNGVDSWQLDGVLPEGVEFRPDSGSLIGTPTIAGSFPVILKAENSAGSAQHPLTIEVESSGLGHALGDTSRFPATDPAHAWVAQTNSTPGTLWAVESPKISDAQETWIEVSVQGPALIEFDWKVSSEVGADFLIFQSGPVDIAAISGETGWQRYLYQLPAGNHPLRWTYRKDSKPSGATADRAWLASFSARSLAAPIFRSTPAVGGAVGTAFAFGLDIANDPLSVEVVGALPTGIVFDESTLTFAGAPEKTGVFPFEITASNVVGSITQNAQIVIDGPALATGLDNSQLIWSTSAENAWFVQTRTTHDGIDSAQSGWTPQADNARESWLQTEVQGPATVTFWWRMSGVRKADFLALSVNGTNVFTLPANSGWRQHELTLPSGPHAIKWTDVHSSQFGGAWLDEVAVTPGPALPTIAAATINGVRGQTLEFSPSAGGGPATMFGLEGQWPLGLQIDAKTGRLFGIPREQGTFLARLTAENSAGKVAADLQIEILSPFAAWLVSAGLQAPTDDPDQDGVNNIAEYLLGADPLAPTPTDGAKLLGAALGQSNGRPIIDFADPPIRTDLELQLAATDDLTDSEWMPVAKRTGQNHWETLAEGWSIVSPNRPGATIGIQPPVSTAGLFIRWQVVLIDH